MNLPVRDLMRNGVAHVSLPPELLRSFVTSERTPRMLYPAESARLAERIFDASRQVDQLIQTSIRDAYPNCEIREACFRGTNFGISNEPAPIAPHAPIAVRDFHWHFDTRGGVLDFRQGKMTRVNVRALLATPADIFPPTLVKPIGGEFANRAVQGEFGAVTLMVLELTQHAADTRFHQRRRSLFMGGYEFDIEP
jgi:hypothetical protein